MGTNTATISYFEDQKAVRDAFEVLAKAKMLWRLVENFISVYIRISSH